MNDYCTNNPEMEEIILNDALEQTITINKDNNTQYVLILNTNEYIYFFESNIPGYMHYSLDNPCPSSICVLQRNVGNHQNKLYLNYFKNLTSDLIINITSIKNFPGYIQSSAVKELNDQKFLLYPQKLVIIYESIVDHIYYLKNFDSSTKLFCAEYSNDISISDIVNINKNYFKELDGKIIESSAGKTYILAVVAEKPLNLIEIFIQPKIIEKDFAISEEIAPSFIYFTKEIDEYIVDFANNKYDRMIQLSKSTLDSEITITDLATHKETIINMNNSYYTFDNINSIFKGKLSIKVTNGNSSAIEFLFAPKDYEILTEKEFSDRRITKPTIIKFDKNTKDKNINIAISSKSGKIFEYSFLTYYSKNDYVSFPEDIDPKIVGSSSYNMKIYNKKEDLENGESFSLVIYVNRNLLNTEEILLNKQEEKEKDESKDEKEEDGGLEAWAIALIVVGSIILLVIILLIIWKLVFAKEHVDSEMIGSLVDKNAQSGYQLQHTGCRNS